MVLYKKAMFSFDIPNGNHLEFLALSTIYVNLKLASVFQSNFLKCDIIYIIFQIAQNC